MKKYIIYLACSMVFHTATAQLRVDSLFSIIKIEDKYPRWSPDGNLIMYSSYVDGDDGNNEIFIIPPDGTEVRQLTENPRRDGHATFSYDGTKIIFNSERAFDDDGMSVNYKIYAMNMTGSGLKHLTRHQGWDTYPSFSPDGTRIVYNKTTEHGTGIHIMYVRPSQNITFFNESPGVLNEQRTASRGVAWGDYDGDGFPDLLVANTMNNSNLLYRSQGEKGFVQILDGEAVTSAGWTEGVNLVDYDNDGDLDIFFTTQWGHENELFRNEGNGSFIRTGAGDLASGESNSTSACWCDYDLDGDLDVYVVERDGADDRLYNNQGNGTFTAVSGNKFPYKGGDGRTCAWGDVNGDKYPELYVGNFLDKTVSEPTKAANFYYLNNQDGTFTEINNSILTADRNLTYGSSFVDYDQDNDLDLFITNISLSDMNLLFQNDGAGNFSKTTTAVSKTRSSPSKGHTWGDFDNDGYLDLFIANGTEGTSPEAIMNFLFLGREDGDFKLVENAPIVSTPNISAGAAWGDYDRDGDLDLFVANWGNNAESNTFYENGIYGSRWLEISLKGNKSNSYGIGAKVQLSLKVDGKEKQLIRWLLPQTGYSSQNEPIIHFGLGRAPSEINEIKVHWPSGEISTLHGVESNQLLIIEE